MSSTKSILCVLCVLMGLIGPSFYLYNHIVFNKNCGGYIKQAADANTVELAIERLDKAIAYAEKNNLTYGYTSVFYTTESDNIGFWYQNMKACREELNNCLESSQLEKTNVLLKVRESLTDDGEKGVSVTTPNGISRYPYNLLLGVLMWLAIFSWLVVFYCFSDPW